MTMSWNQLEGRLDRTSGAGPPGAFGAHGPQAAPVSGLGGPKESGSPADIARSLKTASFVVSVVLVLLVVLYRSCVSC